MQRKRAEQLGVFFHRVDNLLVTAEAMQVPLTDHHVGLCFLDVWLLRQSGQHFSLAYETQSRIACREALGQRGLL